MQGEKSGVVFRIGQRIRIKLVRSDKATGEIDFEYLPSEYDVIEKKKHSKFKQDRRQQSYRGDGERKSKPSKGIISRDKKSKKGKGKKPFYKEVTKKGSKNGKRRGKGRRSK